jgi:ABC-type polysaccharide/polyol phosphate transport system ATPase subunit
VNPPALVPPTVGDAWLQTVAERLHRRSAIELEDIGVRYDLTVRTARTLAAFLADTIRRSPPRTLWALRHIDLTVRAGDCVAIVGANGAGKSTLLQVISRIIRPDEGRLRVRGQISSLLNLGVGFDPRLTGRENIDLIGSFMGLRPAETRAKVPDVVDFAELGEFIDAPLRTYSSGMRARLGFAAATSMIEPNVLVLDEVMGTGDAGFREKSRDRVMSLLGQAHAIVLATHDMTWVSEFASYAVLLDGGRIIAEGAPTAVSTLHRARSTKPPRRYGCPRCETQHFVGYCPECGLRRYYREAAPAPSV